LLSCRFGRLGFCPGEPGFYLRPYRLELLDGSPLCRRAIAEFARATLAVSLSISFDLGLPKRAGSEASGWGRCLGVRTERAQRCIRVGGRPCEAPFGRLEPTTSELCSDRESVLERSRLGVCSSRCSLDLFPLRGVPIQPLGFRPPLMCLLCREPRHLAMRCLMASRHYRVSIRLGLGATSKTGSNLLGVCNLVRPP
jgi:hypothetical protein